MKQLVYERFPVWEVESLIHTLRPLLTVASLEEYLEALPECDEDLWPCRTKVRVGEFPEGEQWRFTSMRTGARRFSSNESQTFSVVGYSMLRKTQVTLRARTDRNGKRRDMFPDGAELYWRDNNGLDLFTTHTEPYAAPEPLVTIKNFQEEQVVMVPIVASELMLSCITALKHPVIESVS